jgi:hypothetical protein
MKRQLLRNQYGEDIEKYIRNAERGRLPITHNGPDVTRQINEQQIRKFLQCNTCLQHPVLYIHVSSGKNSKQVGLCSQHWEKLADTVIGWGGP